MSKLSQQLRLLASARQVSMEEAGETVQGQDGNLSEEELAKVAAKAEDSVKPDDASETTTAVDDTSTPNGTDSTAGETTTSPDDVTTSDAEVTTDDTGSADTTTEVPVDEIETPAEAEMAEDLTAQAQDVVDAEAAATLDPTAVDSGNASTDVDAALPEVPEDIDTTASNADDTDAQTADVADDQNIASDVTAVSAPDADASAAADPGDKPQAEATPPSTNTDTSEAVQEVVELTEALASAQSAEEVVKEANEVREDAQGIVDTVEVINENGGVSMETLALLIPHVNGLGRKVGRPVIDLGISLESFAGQGLNDRQKVSLEEVQWMVDEIDLTLPQLERQAIESLDRVACALKDALPTARDRLRAVISLASNSSDEREGAPVQIGDGLGSALSVDGQFPTDLANELQGYAQLGRSILGPYSEAAVKAAKASSLINNAIDFSTTSAFWEKIGEAVGKVVDPRTTLTRTQLESGLPGGTRLFGEPVLGMEATNQTLQTLFDFNGNYPPLESAVVVKGEMDESATSPALSASKIVLVGKALLDVLCCDTIEAKLDEGQKLWPEAQDVVRHLKETLENPPQEIDNDCGADFSQIQKFVEANYSLATWPLLNYLTNLVLTTNAFVLFAERSLKAEKPADSATVEDPTTVAGDVTAAAGGDDELPEPDLEVSVEGLKDVIGFITSKEKRLIWSLKRMPEDLAYAREEVNKCKANLEKARKTDKASLIRKAEDELEIWVDEVNDLLETEKEFKKELLRIQAKRKAKK